MHLAMMICEYDDRDTDIIRHTVVRCGGLHSEHDHVLTDRRYRREAKKLVYPGECGCFTENRVCVQSSLIIDNCILYFLIVCVRTVNVHSATTVVVQ